MQIVLRSNIKRTEKYTITFQNEKCVTEMYVLDFRII